MREDVLDRAGKIEPYAARRAARWFSWIFGVVMLAAVILAALHFSEEQELVHIAKRAQPWWLGIAISMAQGETWRMVTRAAGVAVRGRQPSSSVSQRIAPRRFNPAREAWLPVLHVAP